MKSKKLFKNKFGKGLVSLIAIVILLSSILAGTLFYGNSITAFVVKENKVDSGSTRISIKEVNGIKELSQLNEGWYEIRNGYVFYLETFSSYVPLYIKVTNPEQPNGLLVVEENGDFIFDETVEGLIEKQVAEQEKEESRNLITGEVTGMEEVTGLQIGSRPSKTYIWYDDEGNEKRTDSPPKGRPYQLLQIENDKGKATLKDYDTTGKILRILERNEDKSMFKLPESEFGGTLAAVWYVWNYQGMQRVTYTPPPPHLATSYEEIIIDDFEKKKFIASRYDLTGKFLESVARETLPEPPSQVSLAKPLSISEPISKRYGITNEKAVTIDVYDDGTTTYEQGNSLLILYTDGTYAVIEGLTTNYFGQDGRRISLTTTPPPAPGTRPAAPRAPSTSRAPAAPPPDPDKIPVGGKEGHLANDGNYYYRASRDAPLQRWITQLGKWEEVTRTYYVKFRDVAGNVQELQIEASTRKSVEEEVKRAGLNVVSISEQPLTSAARLESGFRVESRIIGDKEVIVVTNDRVTYLPLGKDPQNYADELNNKAKIRLSYENWLKNQNLKDTPENKARFRNNPPDEFKEQVRLIDEVLGLTQIQRQPTAAQKPSLSYTKIQLPNGKYEFIYEGRSYYNEKDEIPQDLQRILNFRKEHQNARLQQGFITDKGFNVYLDPKKGYIDETGTPVSTAVKKEKIGANEYEVTYKFEKGQKTPAKIKIGDLETEINDNVLSSLKSSVRKEDSINIIHNNIVVGKFLVSKEGKEDTDSYKEIRREIIQTYNNKGMITFETSTQTKDKEGNVVILVEVNQRFTYDEKRKIDVPTTTMERNYQLKKGETSIDKNTADYTENTINTQTGEPLGVKLKIEGKEIAATIDLKTGKIEGDAEAVARLNSLRKQFQARQFFEQVERALTDFQGLGYFATLFFDEDSLLQWRENVDKAFATFYLGTEYWSSAICRTYIDGEGEGIAYAETPQGLAQVGAHIEATRTQPIIGVNGTEFIYKITFNVRNGDWEKDPRAPEEMNINVVLKGAKTVKIFKNDQRVPRGATFGRTGRNAIVQDSTALFDQVCLTFDRIPFRWKLSGNELCNRIDQLVGEPTVITPPTAAPTASGGNATGDINDF